MKIVVSHFLGKPDVAHNFSKAGAGLFLALIMLFSGCEDNAEYDTFNSSADISALAINPSSVTLKGNDTFAVLSAGGGTSPYLWSVSDKSLGTLDTNTAPTVVYNRIGIGPGANVIHLQDINNWTADAIITHTTNVVDGASSTGTTAGVTSYE